MTTALTFLAIGLLSIFIEFFLPGAVFGTIGTLFLIGSLVVFAINADSFLYTLAYFISICIALVLIIKCALWSIKHARPGLTIYSDADQEGFTASEWDRSLLGKTATVSTDLKPGGHVMIMNKSYLAISQSGYLIKGTEVTVVGGEGESLIVKKSQIKGNES